MIKESPLGRLLTSIFSNNGRRSKLAQKRQRMSIRGPFRTDFSAQSIKNIYSSQRAAFDCTL